MSFTSRSNYFTDASSGGNYQLTSSYETSSTYKGEEYTIRPRSIRRHSSRNVLLKADRRKGCSSPACACLASPMTPRSLLPKGVCECGLDSLPCLPRDQGACLLPQDLYSALEELELESSMKDFQARGRRSMRTSRHMSESSPNSSSTHHSRLLLRLKIPSTGRRSLRQDRSSMADMEVSPASSVSSSRYGSPLMCRSPTPFTPRNVDVDIPALYLAHQSEPSIRDVSIDLDGDDSAAGTEPLGHEGREGGIKGQDPMATRAKLPDSMLGPHSSRKYSRLP